MRRDYASLRKSQSVVGDLNQRFLKSDNFQDYNNKHLEIREEGVIKGICPQFAGYALIFSLGGVA